MVIRATLLQLQIGSGDILGGLVLLLGAYLLVRLVAVVVTALSERTVKYRITAKMILPVFKAFVYAAVVYYILPLDVLTPSQLLAVSGLIGAAIGFGIQGLISSLLGGLIIILERPYKVGDNIEFGDTNDYGPYYGEVTDIGIRATTIKTPDDTDVIIPNDAVFKSSVANTNAGSPEMQVAVEFYVAADADVERAKAIVEEALVTSRYVFVTDDHPTIVLEEDDPYYWTIRGKAYINDTRNQFAYKSDVTRRVRRAFEAEGIEKPEPGVGTTTED